MIQDAGELHIVYRRRERNEHAQCLIFQDGQILLRENGEDGWLPRLGELGGAACYDWFDIEGREYALARLPAGLLPAGLRFSGIRACRGVVPGETLYAIYTAWHLETWYQANRFCGHCGAPTKRDENLRMLRCGDCGNQIFPKICPAVITAVIDGERLLLIRYRGRAYKGFGLIAGFIEIGETVEQTVRREVMEEAGVRVKNIRPYGNQPWGIDSDLLLGCVAELDGSDALTMDEGELSFVGWYSRGEIEQADDGLSMTGEMIRAFREGRI